MVNRHNWVALLLGAVFISAVFPQVGSAASTAKTPARLCVGSKCVSQPSASASAGIKWHPGHYVWLDPGSSQATHFAALDALSAETTVQGVQLLLNWAVLEGTTPGDYSHGFATVDAYLAKLASLKVPKRLILGVNERKFGAPRPAGMSCLDAADGLLPDYLASYSNGGCGLAAPGAAGSLAVFARFWEPAVMDRLIALSQAYAQRYDQHPLFEMLMGNGETAVAAPPGSGFTYAAYVPQLKRWYDASKQAWPHTQLRLAANWVGSDAQMSDLMSYVRNGVAIGGPDPELPLPDVTRKIQANELFRAAKGDGPDLRGVVPWVGEVQAFGLGSKITQLPAEIYYYDSNIMHMSYMIWMMNGWTGGSAQRWTTGILPFIQSIKGKVYSTDCPTSFQQGCNTK